MDSYKITMYNYAEGYEWVYFCKSTGIIPAIQKAISHLYENISNASYYEVVKAEKIEG